ncbi:dTDP-4-dehydrorhamnose 3,5-epimerase [Methylocapsa palsarum]|uniref:dTDP-4-dehydrorhamnose 3,5-epimerase n=1 Tax=Methylocapsa palsarum TaxID=1612308 RepID=A0A1I4B1W7_9HYPH|nr:dTDP-4-dehydrorhamnose 3,5-epimerase [Methylocapsa palsarum]SFK62147.1 dTDP-4-dehydrorhamnose 3,5-epimerase [Methylocapsa palsarum]
MEISKTGLPDVLILKPRRFFDSRGSFVELFSERTFAKTGFETRFIQENQSVSIETGTIRGLHFQLPPAAQSKLVRVARGSILDVAVDLRRGSPTFGRWIAETLSAKEGEQILIPRGFAHGFCTLEPETEIVYKVDSFYAPECESGFIWSDPDLKIDWPVDESAVVLSEKDAKLGLFKDFVTPFVFEEASR